MPTFVQSRRSGSRFEQEIVLTVSKYTPYVWRNVRMETLLTAQGVAEMDILFCLHNILYIIEAKNVAEIVGSRSDDIWTMEGISSTYSDALCYTTLNVIVQNNIHVASVKDFMFAAFGEWIPVVPLIVVPNSCKVSQDIMGAIHTIAQLDSYLLRFSQVQTEQSGTRPLHRMLSAVFPEDGGLMRRPDFVNGRHPLSC